MLGVTFSRIPLRYRESLAGIAAINLAFVNLSVLSFMETINIPNCVVKVVDASFLRSFRSAFFAIELNF